MLSFTRNEGSARKAHVDTSMSVLGDLILEEFIKGEFGLTKAR